MTRALLCLIGLPALLFGAPAEPPQTPKGWLRLEAVATTVYDGNNLKVVDDRGVVNLVCLSGSDAPEMTQPKGPDARKRLVELVNGKSVVILHRWFDSRGKILGRVYVGDVFVNGALLEEGLAWFYDPDDDNPELEAVAEKARAEKVGLWKDANPVPPWWWRKGFFRYKPGMEGEFPKLFPRYRSTNEPETIGVRPP